MPNGRKLANATKRVVRRELAALKQLEEEGIDRRPGAIVDGRKTPWTLRDMEQFPKVTFIPDETIPVTFQGITYYLTGNVEITVPEPIKGIYDEYKRNKRFAGTPPPGVQFEPGAGGLTEA